MTVKRWAGLGLLIAAAIFAIAAGYGLAQKPRAPEPPAAASGS